jgi:LysR family transcriptional regulator for metE and metH
MKSDNGQGMDLEIRHLRLVRAVGAAGSLTRAGAALNLTQSALSHQLRDIESRLGTPLFLRVGKRMMITPAGEHVRRSADAVLAALERTEEAVRDLSAQGRGVLRLSTECYTCYHWLPPILKRYRRAHPGIDVRIDAAATDQPIAHLLDGRLDVAVVSDQVRDRRVLVQPLFEDELMLIVDPGHRLAARPFVGPEDLAGETVLAYSGREDSTLYQDFLLPAGVAPAGFQQVRLTEAMIELVKAGLGVAALARWAIEPHVRSGSVRALRLTRRGYRRVWSAALLKDMARVPHVRAFLDLVAAHPPFAADLPARSGRLTGLRDAAPGPRLRRAPAASPAHPRTGRPAPPSPDRRSR